MQKSFLKSLNLLYAQFECSFFRANEYIFALVYWSPFHANECVFSLNEQQKVHLMINSSLLDLPSHSHEQFPFADNEKPRACLHGGGGPHVGEETRFGGVTRLAYNLSF